MSVAGDLSGRDSLGRNPGPRLGLLRMAIGLLQGVALWWLHLTTETPIWPATQAELFVPLLLIVVFVPALALVGLGRLPARALSMWLAAAAALLVLMGWHEAARQSAESLGRAPFIDGPMPLFAAVALFIGHHLVLAATLEGRLVAAFPTYFDTAWKAAVQLGLSIAFTGAFWILLYLGAALFRVIGLDFLEELTRKAWFAAPVTTLAFAVAVHLTDIRDGLIRGVRTVALMLLSWLLLVMTVLVAGFVSALPFTGLAGLWDTGSATSLLLAATAALIVLINAAYQDGRAENRPPFALRLAVQAASILLIPLVLLALWALALRIAQHGLTPDRIIALAGSAVGAVFAAGYGWAAVRTMLRRGGWMRPLEHTTLAGAVLALLLIVGLFSPLLDPARLSVADQVARLERGAVSAELFDYAFLRRGSGRAGQAALVQLARSSDAEIRTRAKAALAEGGPHSSLRTAERNAAQRLRIRALPLGAELPTTFVDQYVRLSRRLAHCTAPTVCDARLLDLDGDGAAEVLVAGQQAISAFRRFDDGLWRLWAEYRPLCTDDAADLSGALTNEGVQTRASPIPRLVVGGVQLRTEETAQACPADPAP